MLFLKSITVKIIIGFFILFTTSLSAQVQDKWTYSIKKYTTQDGMPSLEVYTVHEDIYGFLWFCTDHGLVRYDGYEFKTFTKKDGLADNTVLMLLEDSKGRFWLICKGKKLTYYDRHIFQEFKEEDSEFIAIDNNYFNYQMYNDTLVVSDQKNEKHYSITFPNTIKEKKWLHETDSIIGNHALVHDTSSEYFIHQTRSNTISNKKKYVKRESITWLNLAVNYTGFIKIDSSYTLLIHKNSKLINDSPRLLLLNKDSIVYEKKLWKTNKGGRISTVFNEGNGIINISTNTGIYFFDVIRGEIIDHFFNDEFITSSIRDKEGNLWVSSRDNGVRVLNPNRIKTIKPNPIEGKNKFVRIRIFNTKLYTSDISGQIYEIDKNYQLSKMIDDKKTKQALIRESIDFEMDSVSNFYFGSELSMYHTNANKITKVILEGKTVGSVKSLQKISNDRMAIGTHNELKIINLKNQTINVNIESPIINSCDALYEDIDAVLWLGTSNGLFHLKNNFIIPYKNHENELLKKRILDINQSLDGSLLIGSKGEGLIVLEKNKIFNITTDDGLIGNMIQSIYVHKDSTIWVGTNKGVSKIKFSENLQHKKFSIINFTTKKGLPSNMIHDIHAFDGKIWFATSNGLSYIEEENYITNTTPLKIYIENLNINNRKVPYTEENLKLSYSENNIRFNYLAICERCQKNVIYKYRLKGFNDEWSYTQNRNVQYTSLNAGTYTFELMAANEDEVWNANPIEKTITIQPHFSKTIWFKTTTGILLILLLSSIIYLVFRRQQKKAHLYLKLLKLEQQALRSSMNPHFIFNALNSIQDFINKNDVLEANEYLVKFSHLIRANLEITKTNEVLLKDELERLELYLSIEKLRFQEKLNYKIAIDDSLDLTEVKIPVMILQPFVENAINHGILPKQNGGHVAVYCKKINEHQYQVKITDNGVGMHKVKSQNLKSHTSLSMNFIRIRLELLSKSTLKDYNFKVINLADFSDKSGVSIEFTLPK